MWLLLKQQSVTDRAQSLARYPPWRLGYESVIPTINEFIVGVTMIAFAMTRGKARGKFGGWLGQCGEEGTPSQR